MPPHSARGRCSPQLLTALCCVPREGGGDLYLHGGSFQGCALLRLSGSSLPPSLIPHTQAGVFPSVAGSHRAASLAHTNWVKLRALYNLPTTSKAQLRRGSSVSTAHQKPDDSYLLTAPAVSPPLQLQAGTLQKSKSNIQPKNQINIAAGPQSQPAASNCVSR